MESEGIGMKKLLLIVMILGALVISCDEENFGNDTKNDKENTLKIGDKLAGNQATPSDIDYSLERYNLIKRAYWVNGQREKALNLPSAVKRPLGYITLFTENGGIVGSFVVDGKVSSLNSFLTPDSELYECNPSSSYSCKNNWIPDVDGSYGENDNGIFFFTPDGKYIEWTGIYVYTDIPMKVENTVVKFEK